MADTDNAPSETVASETLKNEAPATVETTPAPASPTKEENQLIMRLAQEKKELEEKLAARERAEAEAQRKQREKNEEFRALYEETNAKYEDLERRVQEEERNKQLTAASSEILNEYPESVQKLAQTTGLSLTDDSEAAKAVFKEKLETIKAEVGGTPAVSPNNPSAPTALPTNREERAAMVARMKPGEPSPMAMAAAKGDDSVFNAFVSSLPAVERMREIARGGA